MVVVPEKRLGTDLTIADLYGKIEIDGAEDSWLSLNDNDPTDYQTLPRYQPVV